MPVNNNCHSNITCENCPACILVKECFRCNPKKSKTLLACGCNQLCSCPVCKNDDPCEECSCPCSKNKKPHSMGERCKQNCNYHTGGVFEACNPCCCEGDEESCGECDVCCDDIPAPEEKDSCCPPKDCHDHCSCVVDKHCDCKHSCNCCCEKNCNHCE